MSGGGLQVARPTAPRPPASAPAPRATPARLRATALLSLAAALSACSASSPASDTTPGPDATPDTGITLLDVTPGPDAPDADTTPQPDTPTACPNQCAKEYPVVPTCMATSWDIKTCSCSLRPAADGTACEDGEACTATDTCVSGACEGGPPAELVEPAAGWQPEGTPLVQPDNPDWVWASVHMDPGCRACDGSRAYLNWLASGLVDQGAYGVAVTADAELVTLELLAHLRTYDANLEPAWDAPGSALPGQINSRQIRVGADGSFYAAGWQQFPSGSSTFSWAARYGPDGALLWERALRSRFWGSDVLPAPDLGLYLVEGGSKSAAAFLAGDHTLSTRRLDADGNDMWSIDIDMALPNLRSPARLVPSAGGGVVLAYMALEMQSSPDGTKAERGSVATAARIDAQGSIGWETRLSPPGYSTEMGRIASLADDEVMVVGVQWPTFGPWDRYPVAAWRVDAAGNLLGESNVYPRLGDYFLAMGASEAGDGGVVIGGYLTHYRGTYQKPLLVIDGEFWDTDGFIMKLDRWGNFEWMRLYGGPGLDTPWGVAAAPDGQINLFGVLDLQTGFKVRNWIVRTDFWGRTCGMRLGVCADMPWQDCEDGNPCTINWCGPDAGCTHPPLPDGSPCGEGLTCQGAVCK